MKSNIQASSGPAWGACVMPLLLLLWAGVGGVDAVPAQATWYPSFQQGSCGFGAAVPNFVAAWPDVQAGYGGICGKCFAVRCRPAQVVSADSSVNLPRFTQCKADVEVVVRVVDTCPCRGNENWCCGRPGPHLDLSNFAFAALVEGGDIGVGVLGIDFVEASCDFVGVRAAGSTPALPGGMGGSSSMPLPPPAEPAPLPPLTPQPPTTPPTGGGPLPTPPTTGGEPPQQPAGAQLAPFEQCGGSGGGCHLYGGAHACQDAPFEGRACPHGQTCARQNRWYRQCVDAGVALGPGWATEEPHQPGSNGGNNNNNNNNNNNHGGGGGPMCMRHYALNQQCGGRGGACESTSHAHPTHALCADAPWWGADCCIEGECRRQNEYYYSCERRA